MTRQELLNNYKQFINTNNFDTKIALFQQVVPLFNFQIQQDFSKWLNYMNDLKKLTLIDGLEPTTTMLANNFATTFAFCLDHSDFSMISNCYYVSHKTFYWNIILHNEKLFQKITKYDSDTTKYWNCFKPYISNYKSFLKRVTIYQDTVWVYDINTRTIDYLTVNNFYKVTKKLFINFCHSKYHLKIY